MERGLRLVLVHNRYRSTSPSGEDRVVDQEQEVLEAAGHEVVRFERSSDEIGRRSLPQRALVPAQVVWSRRAAKDLDELLGRFRPDVVHLHNLFPLISPSVLRVCQRRSVPVVVTLHNYRLVCAGGSLFRTGSTCRDCVERGHPLQGVRHGCYRGSPLATAPIALSSVANRRIWQTVPSAYLFLSEVHRRELEPFGFPRGRCFVKPNLVPDGPEKGEAQGLVVFVGRLVELKGLRTLMKAWDAYIARRADQAEGASLRLVIAGSGPLEGEVRSWARSRPSVEVTGLLSREGCAALVRQATAAVVPSEWQEPFGLAVAEAMAAGVPPVVPAHGAFPELITDGRDGVLYPAGDHDALAALLHEIGERPDWAARLGRAARVTYEQRFAPSVVLTQLESIYRFAIDHPRWPGPDLVAPTVAARAPDAG